MIRCPYLPFQAKAARGAESALLRPPPTLGAARAGERPAASVLATVPNPG